MNRRDLLRTPLLAGMAPLAGFASRYDVATRSVAAPALELIVLRDNESGLEASICPSQGGELSSLRLRHKGEWRELLYRAADYRPTEGWRGKAPLLWPATGRSLSPRGAGYVWKDRLYEMPDHGFVRDMPWNVAERGSDAAAAHTTLRIADSAVTRRQYPFGFGLTVNYRVSSGALEIRYTVSAARSNSDPMFFSIGNHITFRTPFIEGTPPAGVRLFTPASVELVKSPERLPTGETRAWKLDGPVPLSRLKPNEALTLTGYPDGSPYVTLEDPGGLGIRMSHSPTSIPAQPVALFNLWGDAAAGYFSPEPWVGLQNSFNLKKGLLQLQQGGEFGWRIRIERTGGRSE